MTTQIMQTDYKRTVQFILFTPQSRSRGAVTRERLMELPSRLCPAHPGALGHWGRASISLPGLQGLWGSTQEMKPIYDQTSAHLCHYGKVINIRKGKDITHSI